MHFIKNLILPVFLLFSICLLHGKSPQPVVSLSPFTGEGLSTEQLQKAHAKFKTELLKLNKYQIVEQSKLSAILQEQEFQQSDVVTSDSAVEKSSSQTQNSQNAQKLIFASITKMGRVKSLQARLVDASTGRVEKTAVLDTKASFKKILFQKMLLKIFKVFFIFWTDFWFLDPIFGIFGRKSQTRIFKT